MDSNTSNGPDKIDVNIWTSPRRRSAVRKTLHERISQSQNTQEDVVKRMINYLKTLKIPEDNQEIFNKKARYEVLAMAMHLCETYRIKDQTIVDKILLEMFTLSHHTEEWFRFLNPFSSVNSTIEPDSLYPFRPMWRNYNGVREKCWITDRHLRALEYYLSMANKHVFLVIHDFTEETRQGSQKRDATFEFWNPPCKLLVLGGVHSSSSRCVNGHYLTLRPNLEAISREYRFSNGSDNIDRGTNSESGSSPTAQISSDDDSEVCSITTDLVPAIERVDLNGRFRPVVGDEDRSGSDSLSSSPGTEILFGSRHSPTNTDILFDNPAVSQESANLILPDDATGVVSDRQFQSEGKTETKTSAAQTNVYTTVTLVNYPLESPIMGIMTPLTLACLQGAPEAVIVLIRYGATPTHTFSHTKCYMHDQNQPLYVTINQLNLFSTNILEALKYDNSDPTNDRVTYHRSIMRNRGSDWLQCLAYMSLVMKTWPQIMTTEDTKSHQCPAPGPCLSIEFAEYLPEICSGAVPADLQQQCRCTIRETLAHFRELPEGIQKLPLPDSVKDYIDLKQ